MQSLAREMNFSETVFVLPPSSPDADVRIRIFTPAVELPFAGHPELGTAFVLGGPLQKIVIRLETGRRRRSGRARARRRRGSSSAGWSSRSRAGSRSTNERRDPRRARRRRAPGLPVERYELGPGHVYVELARPTTSPRVEPDLGALARATGDGVNCFARDGARLEDAHVRAVHGVAEDPATGSAAGPARDPPRPSRPHRVRRADRDHAGRRDQPAVDALRAGRRLGASRSSA